MLYEFDQQQIATFISSEVTDERLMARIKNRDEAALSAMYHRHTPILRTVISRVVHNESDVEDLLQEVFLEMWNRAQSYDETKGKVLGWLVTLARRRAIDRVRRRQAYARAEERLRLETEHEPQTARYHGVEDDVIAAQTARNSFKKAARGPAGGPARGVANGLLQGLEPARNRGQDGDPAGHDQNPPRAGGAEGPGGHPLPRRRRGMVV